VDPTQPVYCIPSYQRYTTIADKALTTLAKAGVDPGQIEIWCANNEQADLYKSHVPPGTHHSIRVARLGLSNARADIMRAHPRQHVVFSDDDLEAVLELDDTCKKLVPCHIPTLVAHAETLCNHHRLRLWAPGPVANAFYMKPAPTIGLTFCRGGFYGLLVPDDPTPYVTSRDEKEDYERSLRAYERDGGAVRLNHACHKAGLYDNKGGMVDGRTVTAQQEAVDYLMRRWPGMVQLNTRRKSEYPEIILKAPRKTTAGSRIRKG
jgi:hypothetical protein